MRAFEMQAEEAGNVSSLRLLASGNRRLRIGAANAGSAAATWNVAANNTLQVNGVSAQFGTLRRPAVTVVGPV